jgi:hypothetical protein
VPRFSRPATRDRPGGRGTPTPPRGRHAHGGGGLTRRLEPDAPVQPRLAAARQVPRRPDHATRLAPGRGRALFFARERRASRTKPRAGCPAALPILDLPGRQLPLSRGGGPGEAEFPEKVPRIGGVWLNERAASVLMLGSASARLLHRTWTPVLVGSVASRPSGPSRTGKARRRAVRRPRVFLRTR